MSPSISLGTEVVLSGDRLVIEVGVGEGERASRGSEGCREREGRGCLDAAGGWEVVWLEKVRRGGGLALGTPVKDGLLAAVDGACAFGSWSRDAAGRSLCLGSCELEPRLSRDGAVRREDVEGAVRGIGRRDILGMPLLRAVPACLSSMVGGVWFQKLLGYMRSISIAALLYRVSRDDAVSCDPGRASEACVPVEWEGRGVGRVGSWAECLGRSGKQVKVHVVGDAMSGSQVCLVRGRCSAVAGQLP